MLQHCRFSISQVPLLLKQCQWLTSGGFARVQDAMTAGEEAAASAAAAAAGLPKYAAQLEVLPPAEASAAVDAVKQLAAAAVSAHQAVSAAAAGAKADTGSRKRTPEEVARLLQQEAAAEPQGAPTEQTASAAAAGNGAGLKLQLSGFAIEWPAITVAVYTSNERPSTAHSASEPCSLLKWRDLVFEVCMLLQLMCLLLTALQARSWQRCRRASRPWTPAAAACRSGRRVPAAASAPLPPGATPSWPMACPSQGAAPPGVATAAAAAPRSSRRRLRRRHPRRRRERALQRTASPRRTRSRPSRRSGPPAAAPAAAAAAVAARRWRRRLPPRARCRALVPGAARLAAEDAARRDPTGRWGIRTLNNEGNEGMGVIPRCLVAGIEDERAYLMCVRACVVHDQQQGWRDTQAVVSA